MLILTKKYELTELNPVKIFVITLLVSGSVYLIASSVSSIPDSISLAIGIPLGLVGTFLYEYLLNKKNKIFDEEGLEDLLTKYAEGKGGFMQEFIISFIKTYSKNKTILKLSKSNIIEEILLLSYFTQSSFLELARLLVKPDQVIQLFDKIIKQGSMLEKEFGINLNELAFLYEVNTNYLYHNYSIGKEIKLNYNLKSEGLLIQKAFLDYPFSPKNNILLISDKFKDHPYKIKFANIHEVLNSILDAIMLNEEPISESSIKKYFLEAYNLFVEVREKEDFFTLALFLVYDLLKVTGIVIWENHINIDEVLILEKVNNIKELEKSLLNYLSKHVIFYFFYQSSHVNFSIYTDNVYDFSFSSLYTDEINILYENEINKSIRERDINAFFDLYNEHILRSKNTYSTKQMTLIYKVFYDHIFNGNVLDFSNILIVFNHPNPTYNTKLEKYFTMRLSILSQIQTYNQTNIGYILNTIFADNYPENLFGAIPLYHFQPFKNFSKYLK